MHLRVSLYFAFGFLTFSNVCGSGVFAGSWSFGLSVKGFFWDVTRDFKTLVNTTPNPRTNTVDVARGSSPYSLESVTGTLFMERGVYEFPFGASLSVKVRTHVGKQTWRDKGVQIMRVFDEGSYVTTEMRQVALWGFLYEEYTIKPLRVWDASVNFNVPLAPVMLSVGLGLRMLNFESTMSIRRERAHAVGDGSLKLAGVADATAKEMAFLVFVEGALSWKLPVKLIQSICVFF